MRRNRETRIARLSLAARRILSSGVVFHPGHTKGYIYMRRRARRRHVIVFEVTAIGTCEENVECSYTRVPLIENEHVQHPSLRGLLPPLLVLFSNAETNPAVPFLSKFYYVQSRWGNCANKAEIESSNYRRFSICEDKDVKMSKDVNCNWRLKQVIIFCLYRIINKTNAILYVHRFVSMYFF